MVRLVPCLVAVVLAGCGWGEHLLLDGDYTFTEVDRVRDDCGLSSHPDLYRRGRLVVAGDVVHMQYSLFALELVGSYLSEVERFAVDGSAANLISVVGGRECLLDLVTVHLEATTHSPTTFDGSLGVQLDSRQADCACELWSTYSATPVP